MQTEKYIICINDETKVNQVKEEKENPSLQIKVGRVSGEFDEKKTKHILQHLRTQRKKWCLHNINAFCCFFYWILCLLESKLGCSSNDALFIVSLSTCFFCEFKKTIKKGLVTYYKTSGITCLQKHLDVDHLTIYKRFQEKINI